jgi:hypothetical protein
MKSMYIHILFFAAIASSVSGCSQMGAVAVNPEDGTVYYRSGSSEKLWICPNGQDCKDSDRNMTVSAVDLEYVAGELWVADGKEVRACSLTGDCARTINTQVEKPVGIAAAPGGAVYILGASGDMAKCSSDGACQISN